MLAYVKLDKDYGEFPVLRVLPPSYERKLLPVLQLISLKHMSGRPESDDDAGDERALAETCDVAGVLWKAIEIVNIMKQFDGGKGASAPASLDERTVTEKSRKEWLQEHCTPAVIHKYDARLQQGSGQDNHALLTKYLLHQQLWVRNLESLHTRFLDEYDRHVKECLALSAAGDAEAQVTLATWLVEQAKEISKVYTEEREKLLAKARVVYMTNDAAIVSRGRSNDTTTRNFTIAHTLFDEAAFSMAPTTLVLMSLTKGRCVLVGDERQLPIVVKHRAAVAANLNRSIFESLAGILNRPVPAASLHSLQSQYRMDIVIGDYVSHEFYEGKLRAISNIPGEAVIISPDALSTPATRGRSFLRLARPFQTLLPDNKLASEMVQYVNPQHFGNNAAYHFIHDWTADFKPQSTLNAGEARTVRYTCGSLWVVMCSCYFCSSLSHCFVL
jgi:hypothetical protein